MSVLLVFSAAMICVATAYSLRGNATTGAAIMFSGFNGVGVLIAFAAFTAASAALGTAFGVCLLMSLMLHEMGHVLAYRMLGHANPRVRMVPFVNNHPISDQPLTSEGQEFFVALMGPGFSLAPMVLASALSVYLAGSMPEISVYLAVFAITCGSLNFINLLPFWPLDGGRCATIAARNFWPALAPAMTAFMCAAFASASLRTGSITLMVLAGVGAHSLWRKRRDFGTPLGPDAGLIALAAYAFTMAAHFAGGWTLLHTFF